jgi:hypothetical protein
LEVGKEGEGTAFVKWKDPEPFGVCIGWGGSGSWITEGDLEYCKLKHVLVKVGFYYWFYYAV